MPRVVAVSLVQYDVAHGVPDWSPATWMRGTAPGRCWIEIELEGRLLPVAVLLCNVDPWPLGLR